MTAPAVRPGWSRPLAMPVLLGTRPLPPESACEVASLGDAIEVIALHVARLDDRTLTVRQVRDMQNIARELLRRASR